MKLYDSLKKVLFEGNYRRVLVVPAMAFILFFVLIFVFPTVPQGIDLRGGTMIIIRTQTALEPGAVEDWLLNAQGYDLKDLSVSTISSPAGYGVAIEYLENSSLAEAGQLINGGKNAEAIALLKSVNYLNGAFVDLDADALASEYLALADEFFHSGMQKGLKAAFFLEEDLRFQKREIGPALGQTFWDSAILVSIVAFVAIVLVIFLFFREVIPSAAIIAAAVFDMGCALALMAVFQIPLSLASIPALLMLIGYSVDTDIMLTTRLLKRREKTAAQRAMAAMDTGLTMTLTTLSALTAMLVLAYFSQMEVVFEIAAVLLFGLFGDLFSTWSMNAQVLLWYVEKKQGS